MSFPPLDADHVLTRLLCWPLALGLCLIAAAAGAAEPTVLRVNVFPGAQNLPLYIGLAQGIFEKHGLKVDLQFTPNSNAQRSVDLLGPYQATGAFVMREWAAANATTLERYLAAYVESLRYALQPAHRAESAMKQAGH